MCSVVADVTVIAIQLSAAHLEENFPGSSAVHARLSVKRHEYVWMRGSILWYSWRLTCFPHQPQTLTCHLRSLGSEWRARSRPCLQAPRAAGSGDYSCSHRLSCLSFCRVATSARKQKKQKKKTSRFSISPWITSVCPSVSDRRILRSVFKN